MYKTKKPKPKALKRKAKFNNNSLPPSKMAILNVNHLSSYENSADELELNTDPIKPFENSQEILAIKMKFISSIKDLKDKVLSDPNNGFNHVSLFEKNFLEFFDDSVESSPNNIISPKAITMDDVKSLIESSVTSKLDALIKTSNSFLATSIPNSSLKPYSNIVSQGLSTNTNIASPSLLSTNTSAFPLNSSAVSAKLASQKSFFVQIHDPRTKPISGEQIWQLVKILIDPIKLAIKINNVYINKQGKVLFFLETLKDQIALHDKLMSLNHEVLKLLSISQKKEQKAKIIITNVDNSVPFEIISKKIMENEYIKPFIKPGDNITLIRRTKGNGLHSAIICEVPKELKEKILSIQRMWFGYFTAYLKNFVKTKQCFNCAEFGHFKNSCSSNPACILCSESHCLFDCPTKNATKFKCINCIKSSNPKNQHPANSLKCPHYSSHFNDKHNNSLNLQIQGINILLTP